MNEQKILDNAPLHDWTHVSDDMDTDAACFYSYLKQVETPNGQEFYKLGTDPVNLYRPVWNVKQSIYNTTRSRIDIERIVELEKKRVKLLSCLLDIQSACIGQITLSYGLDAEYIGRQITDATGMTYPELDKELEANKL